jgi:hypothetical protein
VEISKGENDESDELREELPGSQMGTTTREWRGRDARFVDLFVCVVVSRVSTWRKSSKFERQSTLNNSSHHLRELPDLIHNSYLY